MSTAKIAGYRDVDPAKVKLVNKFKMAEERLLREAEAVREKQAGDARWVAVAMTHFQEGFMALNRAVMQPRRLNDDEMRGLQDDAL